MHCSHLVTWKWVSPTSTLLFLFFISSSQEGLLKHQVMSLFIAFWKLLNSLSWSPLLFIIWCLCVSELRPRSFPFVSDPGSLRPSFCFLSIPSPFLPLSFCSCFCLSVLQALLMAKPVRTLLLRRHLGRLFLALLSKVVCTSETVSDLFIVVISTCPAQCFS